MKLAGLIGGLFASLLGYFAQYFAKKTALGLAAVAVFAILTLGFAAFISSLLVGISVAFPSTCWFTFLIPDGSSAMISAVISGYVARWAYDWHTENLRIMSYIT